jgi:hypothetical protein
VRHVPDIARRHCSADTSKPRRASLRRDRPVQARRGDRVCRDY